MGVFANDLGSTLRKNLKGLHLDEYAKSKRVFPKWCEQVTMDHAYDDVLDVVGPGLLTQKSEGGEIAEGSIMEDLVTRHRALTYAKKIIISKETEEDCKYKEALDAGKMLTNGAFKTQDYLMSLLLVRAFDSNYPVSDGVAVFSASHTLAGGGTFSNLLPTPFSPSRLSVTTAATMAMQMPDRDGTIGSYELKRVVYPVAQHYQWCEITDSEKAPEAGEYNRVNVVKSEMSLEKVPNRFWQDTTTRYFFQTDAEGGFSYRERRKLTSRTWVDNDNEVMKHAISFRMAAGLPSNARAQIGVNA